MINPKLLNNFIKVCERAAFGASKFKGKKYASIIIISHKAKNKNIEKCINELDKKNFVINRPKFIRIEEI